MLKWALTDLTCQFELYPLHSKTCLSWVVWPRPRQWQSFYTSILICLLSWIHVLRQRGGEETWIVPLGTRVLWSDVIKTNDWLNVRLGHCYQFVSIIQLGIHAAQRFSILERTARDRPSCWAWRPLWEDCCCYWSQSWCRPRLRSCETLCSNESRPNHSRMSK